MAEQTNFYAVQRGAPQSFKPVSDRVINLYLYINIHTNSGRRPETNFGYFLCKAHLCTVVAVDSCFAHFHAKFITFKEKTKGSL